MMFSFLILKSMHKILKIENTEFLNAFLLVIKHLENLCNVTLKKKLYIEEMENYKLMFPLQNSDYSSKISLLCSENIF